MSRTSRATAPVNFFNILLGACPTLPSWRGEGGASGCETSDPEKLEVHSVEYTESVFGRWAIQMITDRSPQ